MELKLMVLGKELFKAGVHFSEGCGQFPFGSTEIGALIGVELGRGATTIFICI